MNNKPSIKIGIVAVSRDCFPESLSVNRRKALVEAYKNKYNADEIYECPICIVESEIHMQQALEDVRKAGCNALCVYLGNFLLFIKNFAIIINISYWGRYGFDRHYEAYSATRVATLTLS